MLSHVTFKEVALSYGPRKFSLLWASAICSSISQNRDDVVENFVDS